MMIPPTMRWICLAASLLILLSSCVEDNRHIRPASDAEAAWSTGAGRVTISWDPIMAESFNLYMSSRPGGSGSDQEIINVSNPIQITDLKIGASYYFRIAALSGGKISLQSKEIGHTARSPDDSLKLPFTGQTTEITLAWNNTDEAVAYNIYWRNIPGVTRQNGIKVPNVQNPHTLKGLIRGATYHFVITAVGKSGGESAVSKEIAHKTK